MKAALCAPFRIFSGVWARVEGYPENSKPSPHLSTHQRACLLAIPSRCPALLYSLSACRPQGSGSVCLGPVRYGHHCVGPCLNLGYGRLFPWYALGPFFHWPLHRLPQSMG